MRRSGIYGFKLKALMIMVVLFAATSLFAQGPDRIYTIKNGNMYIRLSKKIKLTQLDEFITHFELKDIGLKRLFVRGLEDSIKMAGWAIEKNTKEELIIWKPLFSSEDIVNPAELIMFTGQHPPFNALFPSVSNTVAYGYNRFRNKKPFAVKDSVVRFYLKENQTAGRVMLAGSFNEWNPETLPMTKTDSGWIADVRLSPGKYWYKFIVDGNWTTDTDNLLSENDGLGNTNSVFYYTNKVFYLEGYKDAKKVFLAGSFNNWEENELAMQWFNGRWQLPVYLGEGTHTYRFIVDKKWISDPANPEGYPNEFNETNSVIRIGKPYLFRLNGYTNANQVLLTGSFNGWSNKVMMKKTATGWELPFVIASGIHEYLFIVDGIPVNDPGAAKNSKANSVLVLNPNYVFRLEGFEGAKEVFVAGDFNNWDPSGLQMKKINGEWTISVHLSPGKHLYKFIVDGNWIMDPNNKLWEQNEHKTGNSVIWFEQTKE